MLKNVQREYWLHGEIALHLGVEFRSNDKIGTISIIKLFKRDCTEVLTGAGGLIEVTISHFTDPPFIQAGGLYYS